MQNFRTRYINELTRGPIPPFNNGTIGRPTRLIRPIVPFSRHKHVRIHGVSPVPLMNLRTYRPISAEEAWKSYKPDKRPTPNHADPPKPENQVTDPKKTTQIPNHPISDKKNPSAQNTQNAPVQNRLTQNPPDQTAQNLPDQSLPIQNPLVQNPYNHTPIRAKNAIDGNPDIEDMDETTNTPSAASIKDHNASQDLFDPEEPNQEPNQIEPMETARIPWRPTTTHLNPDRPITSHQKPARSPIQKTNISNWLTKGQTDDGTKDSNTCKALEGMPRITRKKAEPITISTTLPMGEDDGGNKISIIEIRERTKEDRVCNISNVDHVPSQRSPWWPLYWRN